MPDGDEVSVGCTASRKASVARAPRGAYPSVVGARFTGDYERVRGSRPGDEREGAGDLRNQRGAGPEGMAAVLSGLPRRTRRILIHINNTNPILDEAGAERAQLTAAGIEVAFDGMESAL